MSGCWEIVSHPSFSSCSPFLKSEITRRSRITDARVCNRDPNYSLGMVYEFPYLIDQRKIERDYPAYTISRSAQDSIGSGGDFRNLGDTIMLVWSVCRPNYNPLLWLTNSVLSSQKSR